MENKIIEFAAIDFEYATNHKGTVCCPLVEGWFTNYYTNATSRYIVEFDQDPSCSQAGKTYVCHNGNTICINENSLQGHLNHGDYAGPCSPCNSNYVQFTDQNTPISAGSPIADRKFAYNTDIDAEDEVTLVYPNPAQDEITIQLPPSFVSGTLRIVSLNGDMMITGKIASGQSVPLDISTLPSGLYVIDLKSSTCKWQTKFIKSE